MPLSASIDHLIYACRDLTTGMREIEAVLGVRPVFGGRHHAFGTHNALLSLGATTYLEVLAPDPELPAPPQGRLLDDPSAESSLATWVLKTDSIREDSRRAAVDLGSVQAGRRERADGSVLSWELTDPYADRMGGAIPFLIDWGQSPHPALSAPPAGDLVGLRLEHPDPERVAEILASLGVEMEIRPSRHIRLAAQIQTPVGVVELT